MSGVTGVGGAEAPNTPAIRGPRGRGIGEPRAGGAAAREASALRHLDSGPRARAVLGSIPTVGGLEPPVLVVEEPNGLCGSSAGCGDGLPRAAAVAGAKQPFVVAGDPAVVAVAKVDR